ncbi:hypothetical protein FN846DRAFT_175662 [Sphaerosporella brunnea]|uniref:RNase H type-1 domain-containing protein n=1 Tax=Sphaerosporella brunnea TaxID=1250544 RepID=A0A5J5EP58_9PEZI|nr:hypothetical protein FN846DRAFT_175662 [Sphaerosporella brunnea]
MTITHKPCQGLAKQTATSAQDPSSDASTVYSDGSRLEDEWCGCAAVARSFSRNGPGWDAQSQHLGRIKKVHDAELFGIATGLELVLCNLSGVKGVVRRFADAQAALRQLQDDKPGPGQWLLPRIAKSEALLRDKGLGHRVPLGPRA